MNIKLLDCTLRDGGFVNNWNFGHNTLIYILERLIAANIDIIEIGLLHSKEVFNINRTINPTTECFNKVFDRVDKNQSLIFAMVEYGTCEIDNFSNADNSFIDGIRIIFKKKNIYNAIELAKKIKNKGYLVSLQLVSTTSYQDRDILDFCDEVNLLNPYSVAIVDTYGLMHKEDLLHYFELLNHNLKKSIAIGYHSHNNFQLAYANSIELLKLNGDRNITIDGSIYGMGKSAGNAPTELLAMHLNEFYNSNYDVNQILEALDSSIMQIYKKYYWGYSFKFYISALNDCHPSYVDFLLNKKTLSINSVNEILNQIPKADKLDYSELKIESLYSSYQSGLLKGGEITEEIKSIFNNRSVLILAPGNTIIEFKEKVSNYIEKENPVVVSINSLPKDYPIDYTFVSNSKRFSTNFIDFKDSENLIVTSNVATISNKFKYVIDYESIVFKDSFISDNSTLIFINFLIQVNAKNIALAGFDGFESKQDNYFNEELGYYINESSTNNINQSIKEKLKELSKLLNIKLLTPTKYV